MIVLVYLIVLLGSCTSASLLYLYPLFFVSYITAALIFTFFHLRSSTIIGNITVP